MLGQQLAHEAGCRAAYRGDLDEHGSAFGAGAQRAFEGGDLTAEQIAEFAHGKLSRHKIPRYVHVTDSFPMTASGKVRKVEMREMAPKLLGWV